MPIPIARPNFGPQEHQAIVAPLQSGWVAQGPHVKALEADFAAYAGCTRALTCSNGTAALHMALAALGVGPGDEVIVPGFTWVATANAAELLGARAVLCDVDPNTFCATAEHFAAHITKHTRVLLPVHLFGHVADMPAIMALAKEHGLKVVEDAACAVGSRLGGVHAGTFGDVGTFSFHPRKVLTCGEGGMMTTSDPHLADMLASLRNHGASDILVPPNHTEEYGAAGHQDFVQAHPGAAAYVMSDFVRPGFNYRLTDIQGALLKVQFERLGEFLEARRAQAAQYDEALAGLPVALPARVEGMEHSHQSYVLRVLPESPVGRDALADMLGAEGIQTRQGTHALHLLGAYRDRCAPQDLPGCLDAHRHSRAIPLFPGLTEDEQQTIIDALKKALA